MGTATAKSDGKRQQPYRLRRPACADEWEVYHRIRRDVLLESQKYALEHADETAPDHHPLLLWLEDRPIGSIRIDRVDAMNAALRLVAIDPGWQSQGHGRALLQLAEEFAREQGCAKAVVYATPDAAAFYGKAGYVEDDWDEAYVSGIVQMLKPLG
jgi:GNAT superfamily N-acetyltransferase